MDGLGSKKKVFFIISGIIVVSLLIGGSFLIVRKIQNKIVISLVINHLKRKKKPTLPSDNPPLDQLNNPLPQPDLVKNDKIELKVFWTGELWFEGKKYKDYWVFCKGEWNKPSNQRFLIAKNTPVLVDKDLGQEDLSFALVYSKKQGSRVEKTNKDGTPILTILESNF